MKLMGMPVRLIRARCLSHKILISAGSLLVEAYECARAIKVSLFSSPPTIRSSA